MTIGINGNEANVAHRVGVGQYAFELLRHLPKKDIVVYLANLPRDDMPDLNYEVFGPKKLWTLTGLQKKLLTKAPDVLFTPSHYAPLYVPCPSVIAIMDMSFERFPQYFKKKDLFQLKYWTWLSAMQAKKILTISEFSKKEICDIYGLPGDRVIVTYPGYDTKRFYPRKAKMGNYLLYLGTLQPRKNLVRLIEAFSQLPDKTLTLKIAGMTGEGRGGWMYQGIFDEVKKLKIENRVEFLGFVADAKVPDLLAGAKAYVLPSLYEGFGIPPIEAMATGIPVVVSRVSSLPEICGEAAIYIDDPTSVDSLAIALDRVLSLTTVERAKLVNLGLTWVKRYNWEDTAKKTLGVLYEVAKR